MLKVNISEIAKLKQVAKHLDEIKRKAAGVSVAKTKIKALKIETDKLTGAQRELIKRTQQIGSVYRSASTSALKSLVSLRQSVEKTNGALKRLNAARYGVATWGMNIQEASKHLLGFGKNIQWTGRQLMMGFTLPMALAGVAAVKTANKIETEWVRIKKVYGDTIEEADDFARVQKEILAPAVKSMSMTFAQHKSEVLETMSAWAAMGWTGKRLAAITQESLGYMIAGDIEAAEATEYLRSIVAIFNLDVAQTRKALAQLNAIENATAATMRDLGAAITRAGEAIRVAGLSIAETGAIIAQMRDAGVQATTAGMALKTMVAKLYSPTKEAKGMIASFSKATLGFSINMDSAAFQAMKFKDRLKILSKVYEKLSDTQKIQMAEMLTGIRQFSRFATVLEGVSSEVSVYKRAIDAALDPDVIKRYGDEIMDVLESAPKMWARLGIALENLAGSWGKIVSEALMPFIQWLIGLATVLKQLDPKTQRMIFYFGLFAAVLGPVLMYIGFVSQAIGIMIGAFGALAKMVGFATMSFAGFFAILIAVIGAIKFNIFGIGDFVNGLINNIKGLTFSLGDIGKVVDESSASIKNLVKTEEELENLGDSLSEGIANIDASAVRAQMEQLGADLQKDFLYGFSDIDMDILSNATSIIKNYYNDLVSLNKISVDEAANAIASSIQTVASAIAESKATGEIINLYDELKNQIGEANAEIIQSVSAAKQKVGVIEEELELRKEAMDAAQREYAAQKDYVNFLSQSTKDTSIEISTTEKKRMWEIKTKIKEIQKANLEELQAEKKKALMLARVAADEKEKYDIKKDELDLAKKILSVEQKIANLRLGLLDAVRISGGAGTGEEVTIPGMGDVMDSARAMAGIGGEFTDFINQAGVTGGINKNLSELGDKMKKIGEIAMWVGGIFAAKKIIGWLLWMKKFGWTALGLQILKLTSALRALSVIGAIAIVVSIMYKFWKGTEEIKGNIDDALKSTMDTMDMLIGAGKQKEAIEVGLKFSLSMEELDESIAEVQNKIKKALIAIPVSFLKGTIGLAWTTITIPLRIAWDLLPSEFKDNLGKMKDSISDWFSDLPSMIANKINENIWDIWKPFDNFAWGGFQKSIWNLIREAAGWMSNLPINIAWKIGENIWDIFNPFRDFFYGGFQDSIWKIMRDIGSWFKNLPGLISSAIKGMGGLTNKIADAVMNFGHFAAGGIVPGQLQQAVPIVAHGREMILNMNQQKNLFDLLNNRTPLANQSSSANTTINYNIEFKVGNMICSRSEKREFARSIQKSLEENNSRIGPRL